MICKIVKNIKVVLLIALLLRVFFTFIVFGNSYKPIFDEIYYTSLAKNIYSGRGIILDFSAMETVIGGKPTSFWEPLYPIILSIFYRLGENKFIFIRLFQDIINVFTLYMFYYFIKQYWNLKTALIGAWIFAIYPLYILFPNFFLIETILTLLLLLSFLSFFLVLFDQNLSLYKYVMLGFILGVTSLFKATTFGFIPIIIITDFLQKKNKLNAFIGMFIVIVVTGVTVSPWIIRNYMVHRTFVLFTTKVGWNLYHGNHPITEAEKNYSPLDLFAHYRKIPKLNAGDMNEVERNKMYWRKGVEIILTHPVSSLYLVIGKLKNFWSPFPQREVNRNIYVMIILLIFHLLILIPGTYEVFTNIRDPRTYTITLFIVYFTLIHALFIASIRLRVPMDAFLILLGGMGMGKFLRRL